MRKYEDSSWNYAGADTKRDTHCFHSYPAMMIPQVAGRLLDTYAPSASLLFDPYCGTGTSLVEANLRGTSAIGTDLNPLARLIATAKTTPINEQVLDRYIRDCNSYTFGLRFGAAPRSAVAPSADTLDYWFKPETAEALAALRGYIDEITDAAAAAFFKVAFSETVRDVSLTRNGEFKLFRMAPHQIPGHNPDPFAVFEGKLVRNRAGLLAFLHRRRDHPTTTVYGFNSSEGIPEEHVAPESVDAVVTSPPYGDSQTTVAYGQFSRLSSEWLGLPDPRSVDKRLMGGRPLKHLPAFDCHPLDAALAEIAAQDDKRAGEVAAFYVDYAASIRNVARVVRPGGHVAYVVGNRRVKGVELPTDVATKALFEREGFAHVETVVRAIPSKRMPSRNSPTNETGKSDVTMNAEYVVVLQNPEAAPPAPVRRRLR